MIQISRRASVALILPAALLVAGLPCSAAPTRATSSADAPQLAVLARDVDRVESVRAIKRLQVAWAHYVEDGDWVRAASLFTDDARLSHNDHAFNGRAEILAYMRDAIGHGADGLPARNIHLPLFLAPIVTLDASGNSARGRWHAFSMRGAFGGDASWSGGIFSNEYVRQNGVWKISRQIFTQYMGGTYEEGWRAALPELPIVPYAFKPEEIGQPAAFGLTVPASTPARATLPALAGRIRALRDEQAIRNLQDAYGYYVDQKMWDDVVDLFAPGGSISIAGIGTYIGPKGIRRSLERDGPAGLRDGEMNDHIQANVIVDVAPDGLHARARGIDLGMTGQNEGGANWSVTRFDNLFVKQGGTWRIATMRTALRMKTDYALGWGKSWLGETPPSAAFKPDRAASGDLPLPTAIERAPTAPRPVAPASLAQEEAAIRIAAAYDAVENLAGGYGQYLDDNHWDELGSIFAAQGERDSAGGGFIRTPARIASFSRQRYGPYNPHRSRANMHMRTQPVITISPDGQKAQIRTRLLQLAFAQPEPGKLRQGMIVTGMYEDDVVFEDGRWRIKRADIDHLIYAQNKNGWTHIPEGFGKKLTLSLGSVANVKFDAPGAGDTYPAFPKVAHMWFHYRNPVSGRKPPLLMPKYDLPEP